MANLSCLRCQFNDDCEHMYGLYILECEHTYNVCNMCGRVLWHGSKKDAEKFVAENGKQKAVQFELDFYPVWS